MADAVAVRTMQAIVDRLLTMTGTRFFGSAYPNDPAVESDLKTEEGIKQYPHICVWLMRTEERQPTQSVGLEQGFLTPHVFSITGYTERAEGLAPITWAARLAEDVQITLLAGFQLGGIASRLRIRPAEFDPEISLTTGVPQVARFSMTVVADVNQFFTVAP